MNCKPGDLAIGVRTVPSKRANLGVVVRVIGPWPGYPDSWECELLTSAVYEGHRRQPGFRGKGLDACMRPLRDDEAEDEILRLVGKPEEVLA